MKRFFMSAAVMALAVIAPLCAANAAHAVDERTWIQPVKPFHITGQTTENIYYVGTKGLAAYLITSGHDAILLDGTQEKNAPLIEKNIAALGYSMRDIKVIIISHAHFDHVGAVARLKHDSGARLYVSAGDRWALEHGTHPGETIYAQGHFPAVAVDHELKDGETVTVGNAHMTATMTPGHTPGCTTWSTRVQQGKKTLNVVFPCSIGTGGNRLVGNTTYPQIVQDYYASFDKQARMPADIVLPNHPEFADVLGREARVRAGNPNAFVDPLQLREIVAAARTDFAAELKRQGGK